MNEQPLKRNILLISYTALLFLVVMNIETVLDAISNFFGIIAPVFIGIAVAFILNLLMNKIEFGLFSQGKALYIKKQGARRGVSVLCTIVAFILIISVISLMVLPELGNSLILLANNIPGYLDAGIVMLNQIVDYIGVEALEEYITGLPWADIGTTLTGFINTALNNIVNSTGAITGAITSTFMGFIIAIYMLINKEKLSEQIRRILVIILPEKAVAKMLEIGKLSNNVMNKFVSGQLMEALILGVLCFIGMTILGLPYAPLVGTIIGLTNLIPFFGPILGTIPCVFLILMIDFMSAIYFVIFVLVLQQIDSNLIYPRVVGDSLELPGLWVIIAVIIGGGLFGLLGMMLSVPIFAIMYSVLGDLINKKYTAKVGIEENQEEA